MCRNLIVMAVMLALASTSFGLDVVVGDWEGTSLDGWDNAPTWYAESHATLTPGQTCGVTLNTGCLVASGIPLGDATYLGTRGFDTDGVTPLYNYDPAYPDCWWYARGDHSASAALTLVKAPGVFGRATFEFDVAGVPEGATLRGFLHFGGAGVGYGKTDMVLTPDENGHVVMDYVNNLTHDTTYVDELWTDAGSWTWDDVKLPDAVDVATWSPSWYQVCLALESPGMGDHGTPTTTLQLDYAVFRTPEPTTIALLGLGGLALIRRKR